MNTQLQAINTPATNEPTMSSREIAELTGKRHPDVKRDIDKMMKDLEEDTSNYAHIYLDSMNREQTEYNLDRFHTECLLAGYDVKARMKIIKRWHELEEQVSTPPALPQNPLEMMKAQMEGMSLLLGQQIEQQAKVEALEESQRIQQAQQVALESKVNSKLAELDNRLEQKLPHYRQKPSNGVTIGKIRKAMNSRYGLSQRVVDAVMFDIVCPKPVGTCDNNYNNGTSTLDVWSKAEISDVFRVFAGECQRVSSSRFEHPEVPFKFGMRN